MLLDMIKTQVQNIYILKTKVAEVSDYLGHFGFDEIEKFWYIFLEETSYCCYKIFFALYVNIF